jgi:ElaB/YqjD/DUF883 family membrane-anchored ribosome-binding protein
MVPFEEIIDELQEMLDEAWNLPMTGGKCVLDGDKVREKIEGLRLNFPGEIKRAKNVLDERERIIQKAKQDAANMIKEAEQKALQILNEQQIMKEAKEKSEQLLKSSTDEATRIKKVAVEFADKLLKNSEDMLEGHLATIKQARRTIQG